MKPLKLKPSKKSILCLGGVLTLLVVACVSLFVQQQSTLGKAVAVLEARQKQLDEGNVLASRLQATEDLLRRDREELKFLEASLPHMAYVPTLLRQVEALARETENQVRGVRPKIEVAPPPRRERRSDPEASTKGDGASGDPKDEPKKAPEPYDKLKIQLSLNGEYADCLRFIQRLTRFPKILAVDDVQLRPRFDDKPGSPRIDVDLNLTAFILKEKNQRRPPLPVEEEGQAT